MKTAKIKVDYIDHMGNDLTVVNAARVSFAKEKEAFGADDAKLILYLARHNHWSPFAHASVSFRVKAPIFVARQLVKHTVGFSWNEVSRRYVDNEPEFYFPEYWRARAENVKQGSSNAPIDHIEIYRDNCVAYGVELGEVDELDDTRLYVGDIGAEAEAMTVWNLHIYKQMLEAGVCPEQARMVLPQNMMTEWIWTGTLYAWARMCGLRLDPHTQKETQEVAEYIDDIINELFPVSWEALTKE